MEDKKQICTFERIDNWLLYLMQQKYFYKQEGSNKEHKNDTFTEHILMRKILKIKRTVNEAKQFAKDYTCYEKYVRAEPFAYSFLTFFYYE